MIASAAPAGARVISNEPIHRVRGELVNDFCALEQVRLDTDIDGRIVISTTRGPEGLVYAVAAQHGTVSYTNLANNETVTENDTNSFRVLKGDRQR